MAKYQIFDFLGGLKIPITQEYGNDVDYYKQLTLNQITKVSTLIKGHEGVDFATINGTPLYAPFKKAIVVRKESSPVGWKNYGNLVVLWDPIQLIAMWFCHLQESLVELSDVLELGQKFCITNNTGNTRGEHVHVNFCETDEKGVRINQDNGSLGFLNLMDTNLVEILPMPSSPAIVTQPTPPEQPQDSVPATFYLPKAANPIDWLPVKKIDFEGMRQKCDHYDPILSAGYPNLEAIDNKVNTLVQESQDQKKSYEESIALQNDTISQLQQDVKQAKAESLDLLTKYKGNIEEQVKTIDIAIAAQPRIDQLEQEKRQLAGILKVKPTQDNILGKLDEFINKYDFYKRFFQKKQIKDTVKTVIEKEKAQKGSGIKYLLQALSLSVIIISIAVIANFYK